MIRGRFQDIENLSLNQNSMKTLSSKEDSKSKLDQAIKIPKLKKKITFTTSNDDNKEIESHYDQFNDKLTPNKKQNSQNALSLSSARKSIVKSLSSVSTPQSTPTSKLKSGKRVIQKPSPSNNDDFEKPCTNSNQIENIFFDTKRLDKNNKIKSELDTINTLVIQKFSTLDSESSNIILKSLENLRDLLDSNIEVIDSPNRDRKSEYIGSNIQATQSAKKEFDTRENQIWSYEEDGLEGDGILHWHAVDDVIFVQNNNQSSESQTPKKRMSSFDNLDTVVKKTPNRRSTFDTPTTRSQKKALTVNIVTHNSIENKNNQSPNEERVDTLVMSALNESPVVKAANPKTRKGRRASVGGKHIKKLESSPEEVASTEISNDQRLSDPPINSIVDCSTTTRPLRRSRRGEQILIDNLCERNSIESQSTVSPPKSNLLPSKHVVSGSPEPFLLENSVASILSVLTNDTFLNSKQTIESMSVSDVLLTSSSASLISITTVAKEHLDVSCFQQFLRIIICTLKLITVPQNLPNKQNSKKVNFRQADSSCVSPPNDRRPLSWESSYEASIKLRDLIIACDVSKLHTQIFEFISSIGRSFEHPSIQDRIKHISAIPIFSKDDSVSVVQMIVDEFQSTSPDLSPLRSRLSWIASSVVRFHFRWLLDPLPADISVQGVATVSPTAAYRSSFQAKTTSVSDSLLQWYTSLSIDDGEGVANDTWSKKPTDSSDITTSFIFTRALRALAMYNVHERFLKGDQCPLIDISDSEKDVLLKEAARTFLSTLLNLPEFKELEDECTSRFSTIVECCKIIQEFGVSSEVHWSFLSKGIASLRDVVASGQADWEDALATTKATIAATKDVSTTKKPRGRAKRQQ